MFCVYILHSIKAPTQIYVGFSTNPQKRLSAHNAGQSPHTNRLRPWKITSYFAFEDERRAHEFEKYLKTSYGIAFRNKHLI
ncbi:MAG: GIY-YIG nuclease family protein [Patescibacteria group bacterium]